MPKGSDMRPEEIEVIRHTLGLSQAEMAQICGVGTRMVQRWLSPTDATPTEVNAAKLRALKQDQYTELDARLQQAITQHQKSPGTPVEIHYVTDLELLNQMRGLPIPTRNAQLAFLGILEALLHAYAIPFTRVYVSSRD